MSAGGDYVATLPMYDWPEVRAATDRFWDCLRDSLSRFGYPAPGGLERSACDAELWRHPGLMLGQTCGLPLVSGLMDEVSLIGTPAYDIECGAGSYYSVIVVHEHSSISSVAGLRGTCLAYNGLTSQSGYAALAYHLRGLAVAAPVFAEKRVSGSHRQSIRMVAEKKADVACIDAVSWQLALRHEQTANALRILAVTEATPGLPLICAKGQGWSPDTMHIAVIEAMAALDPDDSDALLLTGFAQTKISDYSVIDRRSRDIENLTL
ncbi:MAG: PhnD/SsuA/transferrin family substrate-binding protein [Pseudomonadota bacterium]